MTYNSGQFNIIKDFVIQEPEWLILGGPSDGDEAQCAKKLWPNINIIGVEPILECIQWQYANGWSRNALLLPFALSNVCGRATINVPREGIRAASLMPDRPGISQAVTTITIDKLDREYGPFNKSIFWLDIEGYEYEALQGASRVIASGVVDLINVEILHRRPEVADSIEEFLTDYGFSLVHTWNDQPGIVQDRIYRRDNV